MLEGQQSVRAHGQLGFGVGGTVAGLMAVASVVEMAASKDHQRPPSPPLEATTVGAAAEAEAEAEVPPGGGFWWW